MFPFKSVLLVYLPILITVVDAELRGLRLRLAPLKGEVTRGDHRPVVSSRGGQSECLPKTTVVFRSHDNETRSWPSSRDPGHYVERFSCHFKGSPSLIKHFQGKTIEIHCHFRQLLEILSQFQNPLSPVARVVLLIFLGDLTDNRLAQVKTNLREGARAFVLDPPEAWIFKTDLRGGTTYWERLEPLRCSQTEEGTVDSFDFQGRTFRVATVPNPPWFFEHQRIRGRQVEDRFRNCNYTEFRLIGSGVDMEILNALADRLNFTYDLLLASDGEFGRRRDDGFFTGVIGDIQTNLVDFGMSSSSVSLRRSEVIDFTTFYGTGARCFATRRPEPETRTFVVFHSMDWKVWVSIVLCIWSLSIVEYLTLRFDHEERCLMHTFLMVLQPLAKVSVAWFPSSKKSRFLIGLWLLFSMILAACYESNLVSIFSAPAYESTMNYLEQVADAVQRGTHRYTMVEGTSFQAYVQDSTEGVFSRLQPFLDPRILVTSNEEGIQAVLSSKNLVFLAYEEQLDFNNRQFGSPLYKAPDRFLFRLIAIPIAKGAAYKPYFDRVIQNIVSGGLVQKWLKESCGSGQNCTSSDDELKDEAGQSSPEAFTLEQMQGAFYILGLGLGLAFLAFLIERLK